MAENKMEQVAAMFGKKLNEEFDVRYFGSISKARFTEYGFEEHFTTPGWWLNGELLHLLLTGQAVIVED